MRSRLICLLIVLCSLAAMATTIQNFTLTASNGSNGYEFGDAVAIDGNTVVVGAPQTGNTKLGPGVAYVFVKPANGWGNMTQTAELTASDGRTDGAFGFSVAISGNTIVVGSGTNEAYVFVKPAGGWTNMKETAKLTASSCDGVCYFGYAVSISGDTVVVGAASYGGGPGCAYVFVKPSGGWKNMTQTAVLTASDGSQGNSFGAAVTISGNTIVVGATENCSCNEGPGAAYVFVEPADGWSNMTQTAKLTASDGQPLFELGAWVSISGNTVAVGSPGWQVILGAVYVFVQPNGGWVDMTQTAELTVNAKAEQCLGSSVSISGNIIVAGAPCTQLGSGSVYVYVEPRGGWQNTSTFTMRLGMSDPSDWDGFGQAVALSDGTGIVGAFDAPSNGQNHPGPGEAFVYTAQ